LRGGREGTEAEDVIAGAAGSQAEAGVADVPHEPPPLHPGPGMPSAEADTASLAHEMWERRGSPAGSPELDWQAAIESQKRLKEEARTRVKA